MERSLTRLALAAAALTTAVWPAWAAAAENKQDVRVVNTAAEPVPVAVQGTATVTGGVEVTNTPLVTVDTTTPLAVRDVDRARQPFQQTGFVTFNPDATNAFADIDVPHGKRLVVEYVDGKAELPAGQTAAFLVQTTITGGTFTSHWLRGEGPRAVDGPEPDEFIVSQTARLYSDAGFLMRVGVSRGSPHTGTGSGQVTVSGYLVDLP